MNVGDTIPIRWDDGDGNPGFSDWLSPDGDALGVKIEFYRGGVPEVIAASTPNDGVFDWVATGPDSAGCFFRLSDPADPTVYFDGGTFVLHPEGYVPPIPVGAGRLAFGLRMVGAFGLGG